MYVYYISRGKRIHVIFFRERVTEEEGQMDKTPHLAQEQESGSEEGAIFYLAFFIPI